MNRHSAIMMRFTGIVRAARSASAAATPRQPWRLFSGVADDFRKAMAAINSKDVPERDVSSETKLHMYGLFKQAEVGPCTTPEPSFFDPVGRAKHASWKKLGDISKEAAMEQYTNVVRDLFDGVIPDLASGTPPASTTATATTTAPKVPVSVSSIAFPAQQARLSLADLDLKTITVALAAGVQQVNLARPKRGNAFNMQMWDEYQQVFHALQADPHARVVVLSGLGGNFSTGMDLSVFAEMQQMAMKEKCEGRRREGLSRFIQFLQDCVSLPEQCALPVIAAVSGHCIGGAIDVITACDLRYCTKDASFSIKETDLAIVADIGTLQRIPKIIGHQRAAELTYTGRTFSGAEAEKMGLVAGCFDSEAEMMAHVNAVAAEIASKSPLTTRGVKRVLLHSREHTTTQGLEYVKMWNSAYLLSDDLMEAMRAAMAKEKPTYPRS